jgi:spore coat polysaccharide biosynthesis protein SpsF
MTRSVLVRCDGGAAIGLGHVTRCLALADELRDTHRCAVAFAMRDAGSAGAAAVRSAGYDVALIAADASSDYGDELAAVVAARHAAALVVDVRDRLSRASLEAIRASGLRTVSVDDGSDRRLAADLAFYPPAPQVEEMDWCGFSGRRYAGWEWVMLKREFAAAPFAPPESSASSPAIDVLVTMGGSDPVGMTEFTVGALELLAMPLAVRVVVGPAFARAETLIDAIARSKHAIQVARAPASLAALMRASRLAVASFGVSAYELAACGVPAVHLCLTADAARTASVFEREGAAVDAGVFGRVTARRLCDAVSGLVGRAGERSRMAARAARLVDGRGAERVAALVAAELISP